jgi:zinc protease
MIGFYQLPIDYLDKFNQRINDVTIEQIKQAFKARVNPEKLVSIWVGGQ